MINVLLAHACCLLTCDISTPQIYAGSKYSVSDINKIRPGPNIAHARPLQAGMMDAEGGDGKPGTYQEGRFRRVYPFTMSPETAMRGAMEWIRSQEEEAARQLVREAYPMATEVSEIKLLVNPHRDFAAHPVFVPAYVFTLRTPMFQLKLRTFVGAFPGAPVSGENELGP